MVLIRLCESFEPATIANCYKFEKITVFNRWGGKVFESNDRKFEWNGGEYPAATYFYTVDFRGRQYKGTISLLK